MTPNTQLKEYCNKIIGKWYSLDIDLLLEFNFNDELYRESDMYIKDGNKSQVNHKYGVAVMPALDMNGNFQYYFDILTFSTKLYYLILHIDRDTMILKYMEPFGNPIGEELVFVRQNQSFSDI